MEHILIVDDETEEAWLVEPPHRRRPISREEILWRFGDVGRAQGRFEGGTAIVLVALVLIFVAGILYGGG